jgi:signal transduction histidine kinase
MRVPVPRRLSVRLIALLLCVMAMAEALTVCVMLDKRWNAQRGIVRSQVFEQTEATLRLLQSLPPEAWAPTLDHLSLYTLCFSLTGAPLADPDEDRGETPLHRRLHNLVGRYVAGQPLLAILDHPGHGCDAYAGVSGRPFAGTPDHTHAFGGILVSVPLEGGRWLNADARVVMPELWDFPSLAVIALVSVAIVVVVFVAVSRDTRNLRRLAEAAERLGRGEAVTAVPEDGPVEVAAATRAFNTMRDRLVRFVQDRTRLLAAISHDLRTPLTTLRLKAELLDDPVIADAMIATLDEMEAIVRSTLDFTRDAAAAEPRRRMDLSSIVESLVEDLAEIGLAVAFDPSPRIDLACHPRAIRRAVRNLMENAVRYGGRARARCRVAEGAAWIEIDDEGPGIPEGRMEEAMQPFARLEESRSAETGGVGLGLAIARAIALAHGGDIRLANLDHGLRATLVLPLPPPGRDGVTGRAVR